MRREPAPLLSTSRPATLLLGLLGAIGCRDAAREPAGPKPPRPDLPATSAIEPPAPPPTEQCYRPGSMLSTSPALYPPLPCMPGDRAAPMLDQVERTTSGPREARQADGSVACCYGVELDPQMPVRGRPFGAVAPLARAAGWGAGGSE